MEFGNWKNYKLETPKATNLWITPEGICYYCRMAEHFIFAKECVEELFPTELKTKPFDSERYDEAKDILWKHGWIYVEDTIFTGVIIGNCDRMTLAQYNALKIAYGDMRLHRGWTIDKLYAQALEKQI